MASFITFNPPLNKSMPRFEIRDFLLGDSGGKGADGRGYPAHMRRLWVVKVRNALVHMAGPVRVREEDRAPQAAQIDAAIKNGTIFKAVLVHEPNRRVTMHSVKITRYNRYFNEPYEMILSFDRMTEINI